MLYNLDIDIIINDNLSPDKFYFFFSSFNSDIYLKSSSVTNLKSYILLLNDYEYPINISILTSNPLPINHKIGENSYLLTKENYYLAISNPDILDSLPINLIFFKKSSKEINLEKFNSYRILHNNFNEIYHTNISFKHKLDFINDYSIIPFTFILTTNLENYELLLENLLTICNPEYDKILIENQSNQYISYSERKNILIFNKIINSKIIDNSSNFNHIIIFNNVFKIVNREIFLTTNKNYIKTTKSNLLQFNLNQRFIENDYNHKLNLEKIGEVLEHLDNLFINQCYLTAFDLIEKLFPIITNIKIYNELIIKYFSLGLLIGQYNKIGTNLDKLIRNEFSIEDLTELLPVINCFENKYEIYSILIDKLITNLNKEKIEFIEIIINECEGKKLDIRLIKSILVFLRTIKDLVLVDNIQLNRLLEKCYKLSNHLLANSGEILEFWTNIYHSNEKVINIETLFSNCQKSPEYLYFMGLNVPRILKTNKEIVYKRNIVETSLNYLIKNWDIKVSLMDILKFPSLNFRLSYHGYANKEIFMKSSKLFRKICPELNYSTDLDYKNEKIKILFVSEFLNRQHSVFKDRHQVIKYLSSLKDFEVHYTTFGEITNSVTRFEFGNAKHINIPKNIVKAKEIIENNQYDIIFYCEIGMSLVPYLLAHMRLAKYQFNTWGHSDTSGISTIDYYISSKYFELEYNKSKEHYSENLILMDSLSTCYVNPITRHPNKKWLTRSDYGFSDKVTIYCCLQSTFKYSPDFFSTIEKIMEEDKEAILLVSAKEKIDRDFLEIMSKLSFSNRIQKFYALQHDEYLNLIKISDIVLETFPFGSCNSSLEAFSLGIPVVTLPSDYINGRFTYGFYKYMGIDNLICKSMKEYINTTIRLSKDKKFYREMKNEIVKRSSKLFMEIETCLEYEKIFRNLKL